MEWLNILLGALVALFGGLNIFQIVSFKSYKKKNQAEAEKDEAEAEESKQSALERRLASLEAMYNKQGEVIDQLRKEVLTLTTDKIASDRRIVQLEAENKALTDKVTRLEAELARSIGKS